jgi:hypothetical protein
MTDTTDLVERLRNGEWNESARSDDAAVSAAYELMAEAADAIERLTRERDEARAGLRALLSYAEQRELMVYSSEQNETVHPTVQAARAALEGRT